VAAAAVLELVAALVAAVLELAVALVTAVLELAVGLVTAVLELAVAESHCRRCSRDCGLPRRRPGRNRQVLHPETRRGSNQDGSVACQPLPS